MAGRQVFLSQVYSYINPCKHELLINTPTTIMYSTYCLFVFFWYHFFIESQLEVLRTIDRLQVVSLPRAPICCYVGFQYLYAYLRLCNPETCCPGHGAPGGDGASLSESHRCDLRVV